MNVMPQLLLDSPQFFFDDRWLGHQSRTVRRWLPAEVAAQPAIVEDRPWERGGLVFHGSILAAPGGGWRLYYTCFAPRDNRPIMMAESADGLHWQKPRLSLTAHQGEATNVLFFAGRHVDSPCFVADPDDPDYPFKMMAFEQSQPAPWSPDWGMYLWRSRDGLAWERQPEMRLGIGDRASLFRLQEGGYVLLTRSPKLWAAAGGRHLARSETADWDHWSEPELVLAADLSDEPAIEFYGMPVFCRHGWYIGLLEYWDAERDVIEVHLTFSRDTRNWQRPAVRTPFIAAAENGWNRRWSSCDNNGPLLVGGSMLFYFGGRRFAHDWIADSMLGTIGFASLGVDRFCALEGRAGEVTTVPFVWPDGDLSLNVDTRQSFASHPSLTNGELAVEVLTADGQLMPDWSGGRRALVRANTHCRGAVTPAIVRWPGDRSLRQLAGSTICLRFHLQHARLFTFAAVAARGTNQGT